MIIGSKKRAQKLMDEFRRHEEYGYIVTKILEPDQDLVGSQFSGIEIESIDDFDRDHFG